jgi:phosphoglycolate phosphatase-like HAD superfamily hydrolase
MFSIEIIGLERPCKTPKVALFDFDGTVSILRAGWHGILTNYFVSVLKTTPKGQTMCQTNPAAEDELAQFSKRSFEPNIGKIPLIQFYTLVELIKQYGGQPKAPETYMAEYYRSLLALVEKRHEQIRNGLDPKELLLTGTVEILTMFRRRGVKLYLVSGTEQDFVREDCGLLRITEYFNGGVFGGTADIEASSKKSMITKIIAENGIDGSELIGFGDGQTETREVKAVGGFVVGVASNEDTRDGIDPCKRRQLVEAGTDWIIPHFEDVAEIERRVFGNQ